RRSAPPCQPDCDGPCCLRGVIARSASGVDVSRPSRVHLRYGPVTRSPPYGGFVDGLQSLGFPPPCHPSYGASGSCPGGTSTRWMHLPFLDTRSPHPPAPAPRGGW